MLDTPGMTVGQIAAALGDRSQYVGAMAAGATPSATAGVCGQRAIPDEELSQLRRELARVTKERDFCEKRQRSSRERRREVSDDPTMPRRGSHPIDVSMPAGVGQWV
ncbi:hypothetical protein [Nitrospira sp. Nam80]